MITPFVGLIRGRQGGLVIAGKELRDIGPPHVVAGSPTLHELKEGSSLRSARGAYCRAQAPCSDISGLRPLQWKVSSLPTPSGRTTMNWSTRSIDYLRATACGRSLASLSAAVH